jgi:hypothetical protein
MRIKPMSINGLRLLDQELSQPITSVFRRWGPTMHGRQPSRPESVSFEFGRFDGDVD